MKITIGTIHVEGSVEETAQLIKQLKLETRGIVESKIDITQDFKTPTFTVIDEHPVQIKKISKKRRRNLGYKKWTESDKVTLKDFISRYGVRQTAGYMGRSISSVISMAKHLGYTK